MVHPLLKTAFVAGTILSLTVYGKSLTQQAAAQDSIATELLAAHNRYRVEVSVSPLVWSETLAGHAQEWADHLASAGGDSLQHSQGTDEGENLWLGTADRFSYADMVDSWGDEKQYFQPGMFPEVSSTGNWSDVGHYTQLIWRDTTEVGCGVATAGGNDILVCRYDPPGNYMGRRVY